MVEYSLYDNIFECLNTKENNFNQVMKFIEEVITLSKLTKQYNIHQN